MDIAKGHPVVYSAIAIAAAFTGITLLDIVRNHDKQEGKIEQKFDDTVKINQQLKKENPLNA